MKLKRIKFKNGSEIRFKKYDAGPWEGPRLSQYALLAMCVREKRMPTLFELGCLDPTDTNLPVIVLCGDAIRMKKKARMAFAKALEELDNKGD